MTLTRCMKTITNLLLLLSFISSSVYAATAGQIIVGDDVSQHSPETLAEELDVFESIGEGIQVIMAVCQDQPDCILAISDDEIEKLIDTLDRRISQLNQIRQEEVTGVYDELLDEYRGTREQYAMYRREVEDIARAIEEGAFYAEPALPEFETDVFDDDLPVRWEPRYRHEDLTLDMFEDIDKPLPFD